MVTWDLDNKGFSGIDLIDRLIEFRYAKSRECILKDKISLVLGRPNNNRWKSFFPSRYV